MKRMKLLTNTNACDPYEGENLNQGVCVRRIRLTCIVVLVSLCGFACLRNPADSNESLDSRVSYYFSATIDQTFSFFSVADTIDGILTYGESAFKASVDTYTVRQDIPLANLIIRYKQTSTGKVITGEVAHEDNNAADLTAHVSGGSWDATIFRYVNINTEPNDLFMAPGIDFGMVMFRFKNSYTPDTDDLAALEPTYLTMTIRINRQDYGPNFTIDTLYRVADNALLQK